jgi:hypothetical protein
VPKTCVLNNELGARKAYKSNYFTRFKPIPDTKCDIAFTMAFTRAWIDYVKSKGYTVESICEIISSYGEIKLSRSTLNSMSTGTNKRYVYLYKLQLMAEYVGLSLMDFVEVKQPHLRIGSEKNNEDV